MLYFTKIKSFLIKNKNPLRGLSLCCFTKKVSFVRRDSFRSFTLIELMVSLLIGTFICLLFSQSLSTFSRLIRDVKSKNTAEKETQFVFQKIYRDLSLMPKRSDCDYVMTNAPAGQDFLRFLSQVKSPESDRNASLIGYKMDEDGSGFPCLKRGMRGLQKYEAGFFGMSTNGNPIRLLQLSPELDLQENLYEEIAPTIFGVAIAFQYKNDGRIYQDPPQYRPYPNVSQNSLQITNIGSLIVCFATLSIDQRSKLNKEQVNRLGSCLLTPPEEVLPITYWNTHFQKMFGEQTREMKGFKPGDIKFYQRHFNIQ